MQARILCTGAMVVLPVATCAQDGLRSASLPERPLTSTLSPSRGDLFLAESDTYARRDDRHAKRDHPLLLLLGRYWYAGDVIMGAGREGPPYGHEGHRPAETRPRRQQTPPPAERPPAAAPGVPKTFYVIAGCYAGDRPPRPEWLPPDCDLSRVRVIPP